MRLTVINKAGETDSYRVDKSFLCKYEYSRILYVRGTVENTNSFGKTYPDAHYSLTLIFADDQLNLKFKNYADAEAFDDKVGFAISEILDGTILDENILVDLGAKDEPNE